MTSEDLHALNAVLPRGRANGCSVADLAECLGWGERRVREGIEHLICEGLYPQAKDPRRVPVHTSPSNKEPGVFVAVTPSELEEAIDGIKGRALALLRRHRGLRLCRPQVAYSETLF